MIDHTVLSVSLLSGTILLIQQILRESERASRAGVLVAQIPGMRKTTSRSSIRWWVAVSVMALVASIDPSAAQLLVAYEWPGNVRELRNVAERMVLREQTTDVTPDDLPMEITGSTAVTAMRRQRPPEAGSLVNPQANRLWELMASGESFWTVVYRSFKTHELTRTELAALIDRGLQETGGSYTALLKVFNLPATDYKRFHAFLYQQECNLPVASYRRRASRRVRESALPERQVA